MTLFTMHFRDNHGAKASAAPIAFALALSAFTAAPAMAQEAAAPASASAQLAELDACRAIADDAARLACFDREVGAILAATETGEVRVVDREEMRQTRRSLFGFNLPNLGLFGGDDDDEKSDELFETTISSARYQGRRKVRFTTAEGAVWEMNNVPRRLRAIEVGDPVVFKPASLGFYFVRIDGQMGVKGKRVR